MIFTRFKLWQPFFWNFLEIKTCCRSFYTGVKLTRGHWPVGPEAHKLGQPSQVGWATPQLDRLTGAGGNRPERELRRGRPRGKGSSRTLGSPGACRGGRRGRRRSGGGGFDDGGAQNLRKKRRCRRRRRASSVDSSGGEA
jgi:hypothetical protein